MTTFKYDSSEPDKNMRKLFEKTMPKAIKKALWETMGLVLRDADNIPPKTPKDNGDLKRSKFVQTPQKHGKNWKVSGGYNMPYAKKLHEDVTIVNWSEPESGNQYLRSKIKRFRIKYLAEVVKRLAKDTGM